MDLSVDIQAREEGLSQWEDVLKGQAKETSEGASKLEADRLSQEKRLSESSEALEAEERRMQEVRSGLEEREEALSSREAEVAEMEAGRETRDAELEGVRDRLALLEKGLEAQRADLVRRKVGRLPKRSSLPLAMLSCTPCVCRDERPVGESLFIFTHVWYMHAGMGWIIMAARTLCVLVVVDVDVDVDKGRGVRVGGRGTPEARGGGREAESGGPVHSGRGQRQEGAREAQEGRGEQLRGPTATGTFVLGNVAPSFRGLLSSVVAARVACVVGFAALCRMSCALRTMAEIFPHSGALG